MKTDTKPTENTAENSNKSKPLLCEVLSDEVKVIPINKITEKQKTDYTKLVLTQTKSF